MRGRIAYIILGLVFLCSIQTEAQSVTNLFKFKGVINTTDSSKVKSAIVTLYRKGEPMQVAQIDRKGEFVLHLKENETYKIEVSSKLYASQRIEVDTRVPINYEVEDKEHYFSVKLFPFYDKVDFEVLDIPVERYHYDKIERTFVRDKTYFTSAKLQIELLEKGLEVVARKEKYIYKYDLNNQERIVYDRERLKAYYAYIEAMLERVYGAEKGRIVELKRDLEEKLEKEIEERRKKEEERRKKELKAIPIQEALDKEDDENQEEDLLIDSLTTENDSLIDTLPKVAPLPVLDLFVESPMEGIIKNDIESAIEEFESLELIEIEEVVNDETVDSNTIISSQKDISLPEQALTIDEIKSSIELVEIISQKVVNNDLADQIAAEEEEKEAIRVVNQAERARSKRAFLKLIAETVQEEKISASEQGK